MLLEELLRQYGTPLYVYRLGPLRRAVAGLRQALPEGVRLYYAVKANPHPALASAAAALGLDLEISSAGELATATAAGVPASRCLYTGPAKTPTELEHALRSGVRLYSVESTVDHDRLAAAAASAGSAADYLVRLNGGGTATTGLRMTGGASQFGVDPLLLAPGSPILEPSAATHPAGLHTFSATNVAGEAALLAELRANLDAVSRVVDRTGFAPRVVDIGGGFAAPFAAPGRRPAYATLRAGLAEALDATLPGWRTGEPRIAVESGRHLVAEAGTLLTTVMDRKSSGGRTYLLCDAGVNTLGGMSGMGRLLPPQAQPDGQSDTAAEAVLAGPLCTPLDVLSRAARVGDAAPGDVLAIPNVGAYALTASLIAFLSRPVPVEVVLDGSSVVSVRRLRLTESPVVAVKQVSP